MGAHANPDRWGRPANHDRIIALNLGLGRDSIAMLSLAADGELYVKGVGTLGLEDLDYVVFADTGREWPHTYAQIKKVRKLMKGRVPFYVLRKPKKLPKVQRRETGRMEGRTDLWIVESEKEIREKAKKGGYHYRLDIFLDYAGRLTFPGFGGDCTAHHKIGPMRRLMNDVSKLRFGLTNRQWSNRVKRGDRRPHLVLVGLAADERKRIKTHTEIEATGAPDWPERTGHDTKDRKAPVYVRALLPLVDMKIGKAEEGPILARYGFQDVRKSGCYMCKFEPPSWWWALSVSAPRLFKEVVANEKRAMRRNDKMNVTGAKIKGKLLTLPEVVTRWRAKFPDVTVDEALDKSYERETKAAKEALKEEMGVDVPLSRLTRGRFADDAAEAVHSVQECMYEDAPDFGQMELARLPASAPASPRRNPLEIRDIVWAGLEPGGPHAPL